MESTERRVNVLDKVCWQALKLMIHDSNKRVFDTFALLHSRIV